MVDSPTPRTKAFISYSHADKKFLDELHTQLAPFVREQHVDVWDDTRIQYSALWREEIRQAIASAKVAVLLVSAKFLASEFIADHELPPLLEAARHEGLLIFQVILSHSAFFLQSELSQYQALNRPEKPLNKMPLWRREQIWAELAAHIAAALNHEPAVQTPALISSEPAVVAADVPWVRNCLSDLTREELRHLVTYLTREPPDKHVANSRAALREEIRKIVGSDANSVNKVRQFAEAFELANVLACLSDEH